MISSQPQMITKLKVNQLGLVSRTLSTLEAPNFRCILPLQPRLFRLTTRLMSICTTRKLPKLQNCTRQFVKWRRPLPNSKKITTSRKRTSN
jgi:hypothetical protein